MYKRRFVLALILCVGIIPLVEAQRVFIHPGSVLTEGDFERIKCHYLTDTPWKESWEMLLGDYCAQANYTPGTITNFGNPGGNGNNRQRASKDAYAAFLNIVRWRLTGNTQFADCAVRIMNAYANNIDTTLSASGYYMGANGQLFQYPITAFAITAELLRTPDGWYSGWPEANRLKFLSMMRKVGYGACHKWMADARCIHPSWPAGCVSAIIAIGVLLDDEAIYNEGIAYYKATNPADYKGTTDGSIYACVPFESGQSREMSRDNVHGLLGLASHAQVAQIAWNQGDDLYAEGNYRLLKGYDYWCRYNLGHQVEWTPMTVCDGYWRYYPSTHNNAFRIDVNPMFEQVYNHYIHEVKGLEAERDFPWLTRFCKLARPEKGSDLWVGYGTLLYTQEAETSPLMTERPAKPQELKAVPGLHCVTLTWEVPEKDDVFDYLIYRGTSALKMTQIGSTKEVYGQRTTTTKYVDYKVTPGVSYLYKIRAVNRAGNSMSYSSLTPAVVAGDSVPGAPSGWKVYDLGTSKPIAYHTLVGDTTYLLSAEGGDIGGSNDNCGFLYKQERVKGDFTLTGRLRSNTGYKVGLMARNYVNASSPRIFCSLGEKDNTAGRLTRFSVRRTSGGGSEWIDGCEFTYAPFWQKLERCGNKYSYYQSADGITWFLVGSSTFTAHKDGLFVGVAACYGSVSYDFLRLETNVPSAVTPQEIKRATEIYVSTEGRLSFRMDEADGGPLQLSVWSFSGQRLLDTQVDSSCSSMDVSAFNSGYYLLKLQSHARSLVYKFCIL